MSEPTCRLWPFLLFGLLAATPSAPAATPTSSSNIATLGRGLEQLVRLHEAGSPRLASALRVHLTSPQGDLLVHVRLHPGVPADRVAPSLAAAGFRLQAVSELDPSLLEGYLPLGSGKAVAAVPGVRTVLAVQRPHAFAGVVQSQAVAVEKAEQPQARGVNGTGTHVGILSDSFNTISAHPSAADDVATGDLPPDVEVLDDLTPADGGLDEGRAMAQLVYDLAPGAKIGFATAVKGLVSFSNNILDLRRRFHADVIVDDVIYFAEPMYSDGLLAQTVDKVVSEGAAYFSSAGNNALEAYEGLYDPVSLDQARQLVTAGKENLDVEGVAALEGGTGFHFHNFRNGDGSVTISQRFTSYFGDIIAFQWDEPFGLGKVKTDFDMLVFDAEGRLFDPYDTSSPVFYTADYNPGTDEAMEFLVISPGTYQFAIVDSNAGPARHIKYVDVNGTGESTRQNAPNVWGHAAARRGQAVAAMYYGITNFPEDYSSPGPATIYFDTSGRPLHEPEIRPVPQITGIDGANTTFFGFDLEGDGYPNFFGTSAAAPNVAAVAALVVQAAGGPGSLRPDQIYERLQRTATPVPLARNRALSVAFAGPLTAAANGDFPPLANYWTLAVEPLTRQTVRQVTIDLTPANLRFGQIDNPLFPLTFGAVRGLDPSEVTASRSPDHRSLTLVFPPGRLGAGDFITFGTCTYAALLPICGFQLDGDRIRGGQVSVTLSDGSLRKGSFLVSEAERVNRFTGAGLVNADAATRHP